MVWVLMTKRKPRKSGDYYWRGAGNNGGRSYYDAEKDEFFFDNSVPVNKVHYETLYWLDEFEEINEDKDDE